MADILKNPENHISKWIEISVLQNVSISLGFEGGPNEYSTVGGDALLQDVNSLGADPATTIQPSIPSTMDNTSTAPPPETLAFTVTLVVGMLVTLSVCVIGSVGNLLTIAALVYQFRLPACKRYVSRLSADTILILNLCVADFCYSAISLPFMFVIYMTLYFHAEEALVDGYAVFRCWTCKWAAFLRYTNAITEWTTLGIMALERCVTIYRFQRKLRPVRFFSPVKTLSYVISLWVFAIAAQTLTLTENRLGYSKLTFKCDIVSVDGVTPSLYKFYFFTILTALPCGLVLTGCVSIMLQILQNKRNLVKIGMCDKILKQREKDTQHSLAIVSGLTALFFVCLIPMTVTDTVWIVKILKKKKKSVTDRTDFTDVHASIVAYMFYWLQYAFNFVVYVAANPCFRVAYRNLFDSLKGGRFLCRGT